MYNKINPESESNRYFFTQSIKPLLLNLSEAVEPNCSKLAAQLNTSSCTWRIHKMVNSCAMVKIL